MEVEGASDENAVYNLILLFHQTSLLYYEYMPCNNIKEYQTIHILANDVLWPYAARISLIKINQEFLNFSIQYLFGLNSHGL